MCPRAKGAALPCLNYSEQYDSGKRQGTYPRCTLPPSKRMPFQSTEMAAAGRCGPWWANKLAVHTPPEVEYLRPRECHGDIEVSVAGAGGMVKTIGRQHGKERLLDKQGDSQSLALARNIPLSGEAQVPQHPTSHLHSLSFAFGPTQDSSRRRQPTYLEQNPSYGSRCKIKCKPPGSYPSRLTWLGYRGQTAAFVSQ